MENIGICKNFAIDGQNDFLTANNSTNSEPPSWSMWYEIPNYTKFRSSWEMEDPKAFFSLLFRNEKLRTTKSFRDIENMAKKYSDECINAIKDAKSKNEKKYFDDLKRRGLNPVIDRSANMYKEEVEIFMEYVRQAEWLEYIEQTAEEIHQFLLSKASSGRPDTYF